MCLKGAPFSALGAVAKYKTENFARAPRSHCPLSETLSSFQDGKSKTFSARAWRSNYLFSKIYTLFMVTKST